MRRSFFEPVAPQHREPELSPGGDHHRAAAVQDPLLGTLEAVGAGEVLPEQAQGDVRQHRAEHG
eukprot:342112-Prorocentrum_minimum.AAC.1